MATKIIPLDGTTDHFNFTVELDGAVYGMDFKFNSRNNSWAFDLSDQFDTLLVGSIPCIIGWPLLRQHQYNLTIPQGTLYFIDGTGNDVPPGRFDLGQRVSMVYEEAVSA